MEFEYVHLCFVQSMGLSLLFFLILATMDLMLLPVSIFIKSNLHIFK
jgi:hypothetical protein